MRILEIQHRDVDGTVLWEQRDVGNTLHLVGEQFILQAMFSGGPTANAYIPNYYFLGLDNRATIAGSDVMANLVGEPNVNGYARQAMSSTSGFAIDSTTGNYRATTGICTFQASGGSWGPVSNIFLTDKPDQSGYLIASALLGAPFTMSTGQNVTLRLGMSLRDCPPS